MIAGLSLGLPPSQWETRLPCNDVSHWLGASLESDLWLAYCSLAQPSVNHQLSVDIYTGNIMIFAIGLFFFVIDVFVLGLITSDVIMGAIASQLTSISIVYSTVCSGADQRKHQSSASLAFEMGINRWPVNSPHKWPVTRKMFPFDDVIIYSQIRSKHAACTINVGPSFPFSVNEAFAYCRLYYN